jgi:FkbM family methyltransferase
MDVGTLAKALLRSRLIARTASVVLRPALGRCSLEQIDGSRILTAAIRAPIPDPWFTLRLPGGGTMLLSSAWAPHLYWAGFGAFEPDLVPSFLARIGSARSFVDIGANFGFYSMVAVAMNRSLDVQAVEPNPEVAAVLRETAERNGIELAVHEVALSDRAGTVKLSFRGGLSSIVESRWADDEVLHVAKTARFDDLFGQGADLVKIDVEGAELEVLAGMEQTIRRDRPTIFCEIGPETAAAIVEFAAAVDYRILQLPGERHAEVLRVAGSSVNVVLEPA